MFCDACGVQFQAGQQVCPSCGKIPAGYGAVSASAGGRVSEHVEVLGILTIVSASIGLTWGLALVRTEPYLFPYRFGWWIVVCSVLGGAAGWGLLRRLSWAYTLAILMNGLGMVYVPVLFILIPMLNWLLMDMMKGLALFYVAFGAAVGIYTLWVLAPPESRQEYWRLGRAA